jgi:NADPH:quinone reductase-like Zn-dependent oxidoreductase
MNAIVYNEYGSPDVLMYRLAKMPIAKEGEVLIKVQAASINSWDWDMIRGKPWIVRMWGLFRPKFKTPGADVAGVVEAVGRGVTRLKKGDEVFGDLAEIGWGGYAEYVCAPENLLTKKPKALTFEQAASVPQAGAMALQSIRDWGKITRGRHVLINGGGVGTFAIQIAKHLGGEVTGVDSFDKHELLLKLGADHVIDFTKEDGKQYDLIVDVVADRSLSEYKRSLCAGGCFLMIGGSMRAIFSMMFFGKLMSAVYGKKIQLMGYKANKDLDYLATLIQEQIISPVIENEFPLSETAAAFRLYSTGTTRGKIIIKV